jgi:hypothetical protein
MAPRAASAPSTRVAGPVAVVTSIVQPGGSIRRARRVVFLGRVRNPKPASSAYQVKGTGLYPEEQLWIEDVTTGEVLHGHRR